jgi:heterotetrameric sarcosine oxidase delta subunit
MMLIACPHCGPRAHVEFAYGRTLDAILPLDSSPEVASRVLYQRDNPRGLSEELWRHTFGCRSWLRVTRHKVTHEITGVVAWPPARMETAP